MPQKLSERVPWYEQTRQAAWSRELAEEVEAQRGRLDILEGKCEQPVDRRLVEEALAMCKRYDSWLSVTQPVADIRALLHRALEGESDDQD
ncbi:MAG TPA: hypothetical protein VMX14_03595 [Anaerolineae bacterium]|nr:hypothetical protein [Anaerolineae bacterium]HUW13358.1 hypothetical protein [Anaerolineae bacterium]